jgi:hypothetical protein
MNFPGVQELSGNSNEFLINPHAEELGKFLELLL